MDEENKEQNTEQNTDNSQIAVETEIAENKLEEREETEKVTEQKAVLDTKTLKICLVVFLATFAGSFFAMYFAADKFFSHKFQPAPFPHKAVKEAKFRPDRIPDFDVFDDLERRMEREQNEFFGENLVRPGIRKDMKHYKADVLPFAVSPVRIKTEKDDDKYNIIVSLKPFQNNPEKISYIFSGNKITVFGKNETVKDNVETNVSFSQDFILPENADTENTKRIQDGNKLVISIPVKEN